MASGTIEKVVPTGGGTNPYYCKFPDGTMIQWGSNGEYHSGATYTYTIALPQAFATTAYYVVANEAYFSDATSYEGVVCTAKITDTTHFDIHLRNTTANYTNAFQWIAIGRWK